MADLWHSHGSYLYIDSLQPLAAFIKSLKLIYSKPNLTIEWSCYILEDREVYASMLADF